MATDVEMMVMIGHQVIGENEITDLQVLRAGEVKIVCFVLNTNIKCQNNYDFYLNLQYCTG